MNVRTEPQRGFKLEPVHPKPEQAHTMPYAPAVHIVGACDLMFLSGATPSPLYHKHPHVEAEHVHPHSIEEQTARAMEAIKSILDHTGATWRDVVKVTKYLTDFREADLDALVEGGGARRVVAAEADAPRANARGVEIAPRGDVVQHRFHRHFVVAADRKVVLRLALAGTLEHQRRDAAREKRRFVGIGFLLGRVEPDRHRHHRRLFDADRLAQNPCERPALVGNFDALAGWTQMRQRRLPAFNLFFVRGLHLRLVLHEQERREMIVDAGALQTFAGGEKMLGGKRLAAELLVMRAARRPGAAPIVIRRHRAGHLLEIGQHYAVGDKARAPMRDCGLEQGIGRHALFSWAGDYAPRRYHGMKCRVHQFTSNSKLTPKAASSRTPTKASLWCCLL